MTKPSAAALPPAYISNPFGLIRPSMNVIGRNGRVALQAAMAIVGFLVVVVALALASSAAHNQIAAVVLLVIPALLLVAFAVILGPLATVILLESAKGNTITLKGALRECLPYCLRIFLVELLAGLASLGGFILFVVPGFIFAAWFSLAVYVVVDENMGAIDALKRSKELVGGHLIEMLALLGLASFLDFIPVIGSIVALVLSVLTIAAPTVRYLQLKEIKKTTSVQPAAAPHWSNYLVILLAVVGLAASVQHSFTSLRSSSNPASSISATD